MKSSELRLIYTPGRPAGWRGKGHLLPYLIRAHGTGHKPASYSANFLKTGYTRLSTPHWTHPHRGRGLGGGGQDSTEEQEGVSKARGQPPTELRIRYPGSPPSSAEGDGVVGRSPAAVWKQQGRRAEAGSFPLDTPRLEGQQGRPGLSPCTPNPGPGAHSPAPGGSCWPRAAHLLRWPPAAWPAPAGPAASPPGSGRRVS